MAATSVNVTPSNSNPTGTVPEPSTAVPPMPQFSCKMDVPKLPGLDSEILTVGREFYLVCEGIFPKDLEIEKMHFQFLDAAGNEEKTGFEKYKLKLLNFELRSTSSADMKVVSYLTGTQSISKLVLSDGQKQLDLGPQQFAVQSVLKQNEKNEGYGPIGPIEVPIPLLYWLILIGVLLLGIAGLLFKIWKVRIHKKLQLELRSYEVPQTPVQQFYQGLRKLRRSYSFYDGGNSVSNNTGLNAHEIETFLEASRRLREIFYLYLLRRFQIPALRWKPQQILKGLRKTHKILYLQRREELRKLLLELDNLSESRAKQNSLDLRQLTDLSQKMVDELERILNLNN